MDRERPHPVLPVRTVVACSFALGLSGNLLLRAPGGPGLNVLLLFGALALSVGWVVRAGRGKLTGEAVAWLAAAVILAMGMVLRAAPLLQLLTFLAAAAAMAFPALGSGAAWARRSGVSDYLEAIVGAVASAALRGFPLLARAIPRSPEDGDGTGPGEPVPPGRRILLGLALAAPPLLVFGALFASADPVFATLVTGLLGVAALEELASHLIPTAVLAWLSCGYLVGALQGTRFRGRLVPGLPRPFLGMVEVGTVLGALNLLFAAFVLVQLRYLFGGSQLVEVTPGLTHAEYVREGFGQLVLAAVLVVPLLLLADWALRRTRPRHQAIFGFLGGLQLLLLAVVAASAVQRLRAYVDAFGLTELRFFGAILLAWILFLSIWLAVTVLSGRRHRFAFGAVLSGFAVMAALLVVNPDGRIARANLDRVGAAPPAGAVDAAHLASLSADAVPTLMEALPALPSPDGCVLARTLLERWGEDRPMDWRSWNAAEARARRLVAGEGGALQAALSDPACPMASG